MAHPDPHDLTALVHAAAAGDRAAADELVPLVYEELRRLARARVRRHDASLEATALVHEAWLKLRGDGDAAFRGREHFLAAAATAMRHILVDRARHAGRLQRGGGVRPATLITEHALVGATPVDVLDLDAALAKLATERPRAARVVELRHFGGLTNDEIAAVLGVGDATVERDWRFAKAWLHRALATGSDDATHGT